MGELVMSSICLVIAEGHKSVPCASEHANAEIESLSGRIHFSRTSKVERVVCVMVLCPSVQALYLGYERTGPLRSVAAAIGLL
jgi:hypothetical protein